MKKGRTLDSAAKVINSEKGTKRKHELKLSKIKTINEVFDKEAINKPSTITSPRSFLSLQKLF